MINKNRALEFLNEAYGLILYPSNRNQAQCLVRLAIAEVEELLETIEAYAAYQALAQGIEPGIRPAILVENARPRLMLEGAAQVLPVERNDE